MITPEKKVAVILVNWNSFDVTNDCIHSLRQCTYTNFTIIVIDNGSTDGSADQLAQLHTGIQLIRAGSNLGFTGGNNLGLRYSIDNGFEYSLLLNNDTFVEPDFLSPLVTELNQNERIGVVQPRIMFNHDRGLIWNAGSYFNPVFGFTYTRSVNKPMNAEADLAKDVDWVTGCAFVVRNSILLQTGLLADNLFIYDEDVDLSFRISRLGYRLRYCPASVIYHIAGASNKVKTKGKEGFVNPIVHYLNTRNRIWLLKKHIPWYFAPSAFIYNFLYVMLLIGYFALRGRWNKLKTVLRGVKDGLKGAILYH